MYRIMHIVEDNIRIYDNIFSQSTIVCGKCVDMVNKLALSTK